MFAMSIIIIFKYIQVSLQYFCLSIMILRNSLPATDLSSVCNWARRSFLCSTAAKKLRKGFRASIDTKMLWQMLCKVLRLTSTSLWRAKAKLRSPVPEENRRSARRGFSSANIEICKTLLFVKCHEIMMWKATQLL